ncbi:hypothetical protein [Salininema proteolyticum]|uniref:Uncharacterized protein n=1 Tax=Salininema proteolyticum TaxID=1607685 RepID=A0ABV8TUA8_9ACTN
MLDFIRAVAPRIAHPIHDELLSEKGRESADKWIERKGRTDYRRLAVGESIDLSR